MRPPILFVTIGFALGLWGGLDASAVRGAWYVVAPVLVGAAVLHRKAPLGAAIGVMLVAGMGWGTAATKERAATCVGRWNAGEGRWTAGERWKAGEGGSARAAIVRLADPVSTTGGVVDADVVPGTCGGELRLRWPESTPARGGTTWVVAGRWTGGGGGGGGAGRGVLVVRRARQLDPVPRGRGAVRDRLAQRTAALFGSRASLVDALLFAPRIDLDAAVRERYARSGLAHILSISGLHVGFLAAWLALLLAKLRLPRRARMGTAAVILVLYLWLIGFPAPALRAVAMLVLSDVARLRERVVAPVGTLAVAGLIVLLADPWAISAVGAWLSIAAMGAVIWAERAFRGRPLWLRLVAPSIAATLFTAPVTALAFGTVAPIGVLANLVAIPLGAVVVPGLALALALSWIASGVAGLVAAGSGLGLALLDLVARGAAAVPGGHVVMMAGWPAAATWAGVAALAWWLWHSPRRPWLITARIAFATTVLAAASLKDAFALDDCVCLTVHFLDVGQGDAAALRTPHGRWIVIDGGPRIPGDDAGRRVVVPFLRRHGVERLAVAVATHGDADHLGGLPAVVDAFDPEVVLEPGEPLGRPLYLEFLAAVEASGARWHPARAGDRIELDGVVLEILSPDSLWLRLPLDVNEHGVVLRVTYGAERLLFQADAGLPVEARLAGRVGRVELLKVGHHGSRSATSDAWLDELAPREAVISVGRRNRYGHPTPEVLGRLARHSIAALRTDERGTITFSTDGHGARLRSDHD